MPGSGGMRARSGPGMLCGPRDAAGTIPRRVPSPGGRRSQAGAQPRLRGWRGEKEVAGFGGEAGAVPGRTVVLFPAARRRAPEQPARTARRASLRSLGPAGRQFFAPPVEIKAPCSENKEPLAQLLSRTRSPGRFSLI